MKDLQLGFNCINWQTFTDLCVGTKFYSFVFNLFESNQFYCNMALEETNSSNALGYLVRLICFITEYSMQCELSAFPFAWVTYESWINSEMCIYFLASTNFNDITWLLLIASMTISIYFLEYLYHCMQYEMLLGYYE